MRHSLLISALLLGIAVLPGWTGCNDQLPTDNPTDVRELIPLKVGNSWSYRSYSINDVKTIRPIPTQPSYFTETIDSTALVNSTQWFFCNWKHSDGGTAAGEPLHNEGQGTTWGGAWYGFPKLISNFILKYPAKTGERFESLDREWMLVSVATPVVVPAGTFWCHLYRPVRRNSSNSSHRYSNDDIYVCPGIGIIRVDYYDGWLDPTFKAPTGRSELVSYHLE